VIWTIIRPEIGTRSVVFFKRMDLMANVLHCLDSQDINKEKVEEVLAGAIKAVKKEGQSFIKRFQYQKI